jgi:hypothetical protein
MERVGEGLSMKDRAVAALENEEVEKDDSSNRDAEQPQNHTAHRWTFLSPRTWGCRESSERRFEIASAEVLSCRKRTVASPQDHSPNAMVPAKFPLIAMRVARFEADRDGGCLEPSR